MRLPERTTSCSGQFLEGAVQGNGSTLANGDGCRLIPEEGDLQFHVVPVQHLRQFLAGGYLVPNVHQQFCHGAGLRGLHVQILLGFQHPIIVALRLIQIELGALNAVGGVAAVNAVEEGVLLHHVPFIKISGEHLSGHQGGDGVGVRRLQGTAVAEAGGNIPPLHCCGKIGGSIVGALPPAGDEPDQNQDHQDKGNHGQDFLFPGPFFPSVQPAAEKIGFFRGRGFLFLRILVVQILYFQKFLRVWHRSMVPFCGHPGMPDEISNGVKLASIIPL